MLKKEEEEEEKRKKKRKKRKMNRKKRRRKKRRRRKKKRKKKKKNRPPQARTKFASIFLVRTHHTKCHRNISSSLYELHTVHCTPIIPSEPNPSRLCYSSCSRTSAHAINRTHRHSRTGRHKFQPRKMGSTKLWLSYVVTKSETDTSPLQSSVVHTRNPVSCLSVNNWRPQIAFMVFV